MVGESLGKNIERLTNELSGIRDELNKLRDLKFIDTSIKEKANSLRVKAKNAEKKLSDEIAKVRNARMVDEKIVSAMTKAETMLLNTNIMNEIQGLVTSIQKKVSEENIVSKTISKTKNRIGEQLNAVFDTNKRGWNKEGGKNALRFTGFFITGGLAGYLAYQGGKKVYNKVKEWRNNRGKNNNESEKTDKKPDEKPEDKKPEDKKPEDKKPDEKPDEKSDEKDTPFWDRPLWKWLKRTAIGATVTRGVYRILKFFGWGGNKDDADSGSSDEDKLNGYEREVVNKPENKEKFENYEAFGENIDLLYGSIYERELKAGYEDELEMQKIANEQSNGEKYFKGIIPYCLDNQFKNVDNILGQNSSMIGAISKGLDGMISYIKSKGNDFLQEFVNTYMDKLPSWGPFKDMAGSLSDKIEQWKIKNKNAAGEMQYFFRQSIRVQTYLFEKRDQLIAKIAKESASRYSISEKDIVGDDENLKKYVIETPEYQNFINGSISSAVTVLRNYNIFDCEISEEKKDDVKELDRQRNKVLGCNDGEKDILEIINEKKNKGETLTQQDEKMLGEACDGIIKDVDDNILDAVNQSALTIYKDLFGFDDSYLSQYLDKSKLDMVFREYKQIITQKKQELEGGKLNNEDKIALAESINTMLALKKEAVLGSQTIEKDYDENRNIIYRIPGFLYGSMSNLYKSMVKLRHGEFLSGMSYMASAFLGTGLIITSAGIIYGLRTGKGGVAKLGVQIATLPARVSYEGLTLIKPVRDAIDRINYPLKFWGENGPSKLMNLLKDGKIPLSKASEIVKGNTLSTILSKSTEVRRKKYFGVTDNNIDVIYKVFDKLVTETSNTAAGASYLQSIKGDDELYKKLVKNYDISPEVRQAISENKPIEELRRVAEESDVPELIRNNSNYKRISKELNGERNRIIGRREFSDLSNAEKKQLDCITDFQRSLATMDEKQIETTAELLGEFKKGGSISDAISQIAVLKKLDGKGIIIDTGFLDSSGKPIKKNLDEIIKNMDFAELRSCKGKIPGDIVTDEAIESLAKIFENIKANNILKFSDNADEILKSVRALFKLVTKAT